jgi:hypothetical protein
MLRQQVAPYDHVAIFDLRQARVNPLLPLIGLRVSQNPVEKGGVGFILPVVLEGVDVGFMPGRRGGGCHVYNMPATVRSRHRATLFMPEAVTRRENLSSNWRKQCV